MTKEMVSADVDSPPVPPIPRDRCKPELLSIVCPAYNEAEGLAQFHRAVTAAMLAMAQPFEVVFVNDGSTDLTLAVMRKIREKNPNIAIVDLSRNFGKEIATTAGLDHAAGDAVVIMDADLQDPPQVITEMIEGWREGYDVVYAKRRSRIGDGPIKKATARAFYWIMRKAGPVGLPENVGDFRLLSRKAVNAVCGLRERHRFMKGIFAWVGFASKEILYDRAPRAAGSTKWNYWQLWNLSMEALTSSTLAPLKLSTYLGFATAAFAFAAGVFYVSKTLFFGDPVAGFPTLVTIVLFLGGVQLMVLGVIGEYLGRVFNESKNRPLYFTNEVTPVEGAAEVPRAYLTRDIA